MVVMKELKNIITINDFNYSQGGASKVAIDTANMLAENGYNSIFISAVSDREKSSLSENVVQYEFGGKEFLHYDNKIIGMLDGLKCKRFSDFVLKSLDNYSPEDTVVHVHGWTKACSSDFFKVLKEKGFKTILTCHDYFTVCPNGALLNYQSKKACNLKCMSFKCLCTNCDSRNYFFKIYRYIREMVYTKNIDFSYVHLIFISEFQKKYIEKNRLVSLFSILPSPVTTLDKIEDAEYDFVYIGRNSPEKGLELFIELAKRKSIYNFLIVGDFKKRETIPNLKSTGWVTEIEVDNYLKKTKVLVLPSLLPEPLGLNVVKAIKSGIPCLVSSNTGACDYIIDGINGVIFKQGDIEKMDEAAERVLKITRGNKTKNNSLIYSDALFYIYKYN